MIECLWFFGFWFLGFELLASWRFYACFPVETGENFCLAFAHIHPGTRQLSGFPFGHVRSQVFSLRW